MIKRIRIDQLVPGMFVHDLNCSWIDHPFVFSTLKVEDAQTVKKISEYGIRELFIDTEKGIDAAGAPTKAETDHDLDTRFATHTEAEHKRSGEHMPQVPLQEEIVVAREVHHDARRVVHQMLLDVRLGKQVEVEKLHPLVERMSDSVFRNRDALISLSRLKHKDNYTFEHSVSVCVLLLAFCQAMDYERALMRDIGIGGLLHDIGKMMVPDHILNKPGALLPAEFTLMQAHAALGRDMLKQADGMSEIAINIAAQHHERYDGTGYPDRLAGDRITQFGQMASIVDVYDALTSNRIYHQALSPAAALKKLFEWSKSHFSEALVHHFIRTVGIYPVGSLVSLESGLLGVVIDPDGEDLLHPTVRVVYDTNTRGFVTPQVIALAPHGSKAPPDRIVRHESPQKWGIDPYAYL